MGSRRCDGGADCCVFWLSWGSGAPTGGCLQCFLTFVGFRRPERGLIVVFSDFRGGAALREGADCSVFWLSRGPGAPRGGWLLCFLTFVGFRRCDGGLIVVFSDFRGVPALRREANCCVFWLSWGPGAPMGGCLQCFLTFAGSWRSERGLIVVFSDFRGGAALREGADCSVFWLSRGSGAPTGGWLLCFLTFMGSRRSERWLIVVFSDFRGVPALRRGAVCSVFWLSWGPGAPTGGWMFCFLTFVGSPRSDGGLIVVFSDFRGVPALRREANCCVFWLSWGRGAPRGGCLQCFLTFAGSRRDTRFWWSTVSPFAPIQREVADEVAG